MYGRAPKLSIGLPVYNGERFLPAALDSILGQTFRDFELIIADNASTDRTAEICLEYARADSRVRYHRNAVNIGAMKNFNRVLEFSRAEYFKWVAADDLCAPTFLARCLSALEANPDAALAYPRAECIDERGRVLHRFENVLLHSTWQADPAERFRQLGEEFMFSGGASVPIYVFGVARTAALRRTRLLGTYIAADWILLAELALTGNFIEIAEPLSFIRSHPESSSLGKDRTRMDKMQTVLDPNIHGMIAVWLSRSRRYVEYYNAIARAPLSLGAKLELAAYHTGCLLRRTRRNLWRAINGRELQPAHR